MKGLGYTFFLISIFCAASAYAQNVDSLQKELIRAAAPKDDARISFSIGKWYDARGQFDTSFIYFERSARSARKAGSDSLYMEAIALAGYSIFAQNKFEAALPWYDTAATFARRLQLPQRLGRYLVMNCRIFISLSKTSEMPPVMLEALEAAKATGEKAQEALVYRVLSEYYFLLDNYGAELDYANKSLRIYDSLKEYQWVATSYKQIAINYSRQKKFKEALHYAYQADSVLIKLGESLDRNVLKMLIANVYGSMGDHAKAIKLNRECIDSFRNDKFAVRNVYANLATELARNGDFPEARRNFAIAEELNREFKVPDFDVTNYLHLSEAFLNVKQRDSALYYAKRAEGIVHNVADIGLAIECAKLLCEIYEAKGETALALSYSKQQLKLQDSMYAEKLHGSLADAEARFKLGEKDKALSALSEENEMQKLRTQKQTLLNVFLLVVVCLGGVIVLLIVTAYRRTLGKNAQLSEQKAELEAQKRALQEQKNIIDAQVVQLASAAKMKSKFLANISHELRTPVTLLNGMLEIMSGKKQGGEVRERERLNIAYNNSRKLQQMVEEILDLTKLEHNKSQPVYEVVELVPLLRRIVYAFETLIEKEHLALKFNDYDAAGYHISIDIAKFEKVMNNLVYNAIKFNISGGYVHVTVQPAADKKSICIAIADSGIGIAEADMPHIFEHFYQGAGTGLKAGGAGIGLSLVKEFTTLMGGTVSVTSKQGAGTMFKLNFNVMEAPQQELAVGDADEHHEESWDRFNARQKLLIVEDNPEMRYYLDDILGERADIATATNGIEALAWLEHNMPDLIISDVMMPGMDGRELITQLKNDERYRKIPVITLTALSDKDSELSFLRLGVDDYIVKPFNADELRIRVYNLLVNLAERRAFAQEPVEAGEEAIVPADSKEAEEFRSKVTVYVLSRVRDMNLSVDDVASELLLSKRQLYRLAKSLTGYTPAQLIKEIRLQKAFDLLLNGGIYKIEDVCNRVGYEKVSYFSLQFYERFGKRPAEFL